MKSWLKRNSVGIFVALYAVYCEIVYKIFTGTFLAINLIYPVLFGVITGAFVGMLCGLFSKSAAKIVSVISLIVVLLPFAVQIVYTDWFKTAVTVQSALAGAGKMFDSFGDMALTAIMKQIVPLLLFIVPIPLYIVFINKFDFERKSPYRFILRFAAICVMLIVTVVSMLFWGVDSYTPIDLYINVSSLDTAIARLGVSTATRIDIRRTVFGTDVHIIEEEPAVEPPVKQEEELATDEHEYAPNILNIDFEQLMADENNEDIIELHNYFSEKAPTYRNKYTGMFEGYNLIMLTCEGFSPMAVNETLTPTLYKLTNNGFVFKNFYTPIWGVSTSDGEYVACTGQYPKAGIWSFARSSENNMMFCLGNVFRRLDYTTFAYHNHDYTYYDRNLSHPNMGYIFKGVGNGLNITAQWPESDLEMIEQTVDEYINEDKFHTYYMTVSGHLEYNFFGNAMSVKNMDAVANLDMSDPCRAYIACNIELDKAMEYLISRLESAGKLDNTVIVMSADHYPYGLDNESIAEFLGHYPEQNFELYKNSFVIWNNAMKEKVIVDKYCSSIDILPTVLNLFGCEYDSRMLAGTDILSDSCPIVAFSNGSFITDKCMFNSQNGEIIPLADDEISDAYIEDIQNIVVNKFRVSEMILDNDYYSYID